MAAATEERRKSETRSVCVALEAAKASVRAAANWDAVRERAREALAEMISDDSTAKEVGENGGARGAGWSGGQGEGGWGGRTGGGGDGGDGGVAGGSGGG